MPSNTGGAFNIDEFLSSLNSFSDGNNSNAPSVNGGGNSFFSADNVNTGLTSLAQLLGAFSGMKQLDLAKDQFKFQKGAFQTNLANQANLTNSQLSDRQDMRNRDAALSGNTGAFQSTADYLNQFGAKSTVGG